MSNIVVGGRLNGMYLVQVLWLGCGCLNSMSVRRVHCTYNGWTLLIAVGLGSSSIEMKFACVYLY